MRLIFISFLLFFSCSKKITLEEKVNNSNQNKYKDFTLLDFADALANLQCEYHHLSFEIIKGNSEDLNKAEELSNEISNIFFEAQNRYVNTENADSASFILFQKKLRELYDLCIVTD